MPTHRPPPDLTARRLRLTSTLLFLCGMVLCFDLGGELHSLFVYSASYSALALVHVAAELLATLGLGLAFVLIRLDLRRMAADHRADRERLHAIRSDFDRMLQRRFRDWGLSPAEIDVALLTVRGLKIAQIAQIRHAHPGTVKSQLSTIFRKSGVSSRTEFIAGFIDELLDLAATPGQPGAERELLHSGQTSLGRTA